MSHKPEDEGNTVLDDVFDVASDIEDTLKSLPQAVLSNFANGKVFSGLSELRRARLDLWIFLYDRGMTVNMIAEAADIDIHVVSRVLAPHIAAKKRRQGKS